MSRTMNAGGREYGPGRGRFGGRNAKTGSLGDLSSVDVPLKIKHSFNHDKLLDEIYGGLVYFLSHPEGTMIIDVQELRYGLGVGETQNPIVFVPKIVSDIIYFAKSQKEQRKSEEAIKEIQKRQYNQEDLLRMENRYFFLKEGYREVEINLSGAYWIKEYINQVAQDAGYRWNGESWKKIMPWMKKKQGVLEPTL